MYDVTARSEPSGIARRAAARPGPRPRRPAHRHAGRRGVPVRRRVLVRPQPDRPRARDGGRRTGRLVERPVVGGDRGRHPARHRHRDGRHPHPARRRVRHRHLDPGRHRADDDPLRAVAAGAVHLLRRRLRHLRRRRARHRQLVDHRRHRRPGPHRHRRGLRSAPGDCGRRHHLGRLLRRQDVAALGYDQPRPGRRRLRAVHPHPPHGLDHGAQLRPRADPVHRHRPRHAGAGRARETSTRCWPRSTAASPSARTC